MEKCEVQTGWCVNQCGTPGGLSPVNVACSITQSVAGTSIVSPHDCRMGNLPATDLPYFQDGMLLFYSILLLIGSRRNVVM